MAFRKTIGFIGGGNMAEALVGGIIRAGILDPSDIIISEPTEKRRDYLHSTFNVRTTADNKQPAAESGTVFLAVKPLILPEVVEEISHFMVPDRLVISIAAGITLSFLESKLGNAAVIRSMPNTPALIGCGATVISPGYNVRPEMTRWAVEIFHSVGICLVLPEPHMDAVTALSGSGPAYIFRMAETMIERGEQEGIASEYVGELIKQTILGAARMMTEAGRTPEELREMVTSPGGTTEAGLKAMEEAGFEEALKKGITAAMTRAKELGKG